jgi:V-type H+-transporting ATPase subunit H
MIAATSVLQQQASDIRTQKINWQSYNQSQMISNEDYNCIITLDGEKRAIYLKDNQYQSAKTFLNLLSHVSKDTTIQYLLVMIDDLLSVCDTSSRYLN